MFTVRTKEIDSENSKIWWHNLYLHYCQLNTSVGRGWIDNLTNDLSKENILVEQVMPSGSGFALTFSTEEDATAFALKWL